MLLGGKGALLVGVAWTAAHALFVAPRELRVARVEVPIDDLPPAFDGYTLAVLADLHHWPGTSLRHLERAVAAAHDARPDAVALLGDYSVSGRYLRAPNPMLYRRALTELTPLVRTLAAPDGVFGVLGNHDHYYSASAVRAWLAEAGVRPLVNEAVVIRRGAARLLVAGTDDAAQGTLDPHAGLAQAVELAEAAAHSPGASTTAPPTIVLAHNPDTVLALAPERRVDLVLAGHTHGGQFVVPGFGAPLTHAKVCGRRTASGWVPNTRARLYVSRGVGVQIPGRFNCPPEVVVVTLRGAQQ
jgi:uncharacterized protein